jgi:DNA-binding transcriptional LysR family regulator
MTEAGMLFIAAARKLLDGANTAAGLARRAARGEIGTIAIGFEASLVLARMPTLVALYKRENADLAFEFLEMTTADQTAALLDRRIDIGVVTLFAPDNRIEAVPFTSEPLYAAVWSGHPTIERDAVDLQTIAAEPMIANPHGGHCGLHARIVDAFGRAGVRMKTAAEVNDTQLMLDFVAARLGIALVPESVAARGHPGVVFLEIQPEERVNYSMIWLRDNDRPAVDRFRQFMQQPHKELEASRSSDWRKGRSVDAGA